MAWGYNENSYEISMTEGDWGVALPFILSGITVSSNDEFILQIKKSHDGEVILTKRIPATETGFSLILSEEDSNMMVPGKYAYCLDWTQQGVFNYNLIRSATFKVGDKA